MHPFQHLLCSRVALSDPFPRLEACPQVAAVLVLFCAGLPFGIAAEVSSSPGVAGVSASEMLVLSSEESDSSAGFETLFTPAFDLS